MTIETENRQAIKTAKRYALLTGLLLILVIVVAPFWALPHLERDLTTKTLHALQKASLDTHDITVSFFGRSAEIVGPQDDSQRLQQARRLVQDVWGVAGVSTRAVEPPRLSSATLATSPSVTESASTRSPPGESTADEGHHPEAPVAAGLAGQTSSTPAESATLARSAEASGAEVGSGTTDQTENRAETAPAAPGVDSAAESVQNSEAKALSEPVSPARPMGPGILADETQDPAAVDETAARDAYNRTIAAAPPTGPKMPDANLPPDRVQAESRRDADAAPELPVYTPAAIGLKPQTDDIEAPPAAVPARAGGPARPEIGPEGESVSAVAAETGEQDTHTPKATTADSLGSPGAGRPFDTAATQTTPEASVPGTATTDQRPAGPRVEQLLADWPRLTRVRDLQVEISGDRIQVSGQVDSLAERRRIENQAPSYLSAGGLQMDLSLAPRDASQLAEYLNGLVLERFRFSGPGTRFAVGATLAMDRIAETMNSYPHIRLGLVGFADPQTHAFARRTIARHRAAAAYHALRKRGVDGRRLLMPDFAEPRGQIGAWYRPAQNDPNGQIQLFSLQGNYPWSIPPSK